jgi:hypothetical protein
MCSRVRHSYIRVMYRQIALLWEPFFSASKYPVPFLVSFGHPVPDQFLYLCRELRQLPRHDWHKTVPSGIV